jgi:hypothetical protein
MEMFQDQLLSQIEACVKRARKSVGMTGAEMVGLDDVPTEVAPLLPLLEALATATSAEKCIQVKAFPEGTRTPGDGPTA